MPKAPHSEAVAPGSPWTTEVFAREDAAPLRVSCRCLSRHTLLLADERELFVALWECRKGGFVVAHSTPDGLGETAGAAADLDAAMALLEGYCAGLDPCRWPSVPASVGPSLAALLTDLSRRDTCVRRFLALAGDALDEWQDIATGACAAL